MIIDLPLRQINDFIPKVNNKISNLWPDLITTTSSHPLAVPFPPAPLTIAIPEYPKMVPQKPLPVAAYNKMTQQYPQRQPLGVNVNIHNRPPEQEMRPICKTMQHQPQGGSNKAFVQANAGLKGHLRPISGIPAFNSLGPLANPKALGPQKPAVTHPDLATLPPPGEATKALYNSTKTLDFYNLQPSKCTLDEILSLGTGQ